MPPHAIRRYLTTALLLTAVLAGPAPADRSPRVAIGADLPDYRTKYYLLHTDVQVELARETDMRLTRMFESYQRRARGMGRISSRLKVYLYSDRDDYDSDTGAPNSGGIFYRRLGILARARPADPEVMWQTLQHECFHQFAYHLINRSMPVWLNEGLATYFGAAEWTGDGFVTELRPPDRIELVQEALVTGEAIDFATLLQIDSSEWNDIRDDDLERGRLHYSQSWSMVYFLLHAEDGRYAEGFSRHLNNIHRQRSRAIREFDEALLELEDNWKAWIASLDDTGTMATLDGHYDVVAATLTSFLARTHLQGQTFDSGEAFLAAAEDESLELPPNTSYQWLPLPLLENALTRLADLNELAETVDDADAAVITIDTTGETPTLILTRADGATFTGSFTIEEDVVTDVDVTIAHPDDEADDDS